MAASLRGNWPGAGDLSVPLALAWLAGAATGGLATALYFVWARSGRTDLRLTRGPAKANASSRLTTDASGDVSGAVDIPLTRGVPTLNSVLEELEADFHVSQGQLYNIMRQFVAEMERGLTEAGGSMKMIPSFVDRRPTGKEQGSFLALDLGGTNFRVVQVLLEGRGNYRSVQEKFIVSEACKTGSARQLFDFLSDCIADFLVKHGVDKGITHHMGFTFSFPIQQTSINSGKLLTWTKGFSASGVEGNDVVYLLAESLKRKGVAVEVDALANDTVGTLVTRAYSDPDCFVGVILGTGTNAAYVEKASAISKWKGPIPATGEMIVNMEWGGFDSKEGKVLALTKYDRQLDHGSAHPSEQIYEKLISGMYLGEIARLVVCDLVERRLLFNGLTSKQMETPYGFDTSLMSRIERDHSADLRDTRTVLEELMGIGRTSYGDRMTVKRICELVGIRAARLAAAGVAGVITKINRVHGCTVAVDGSVYEHYPHFGSRMRDALRELFGISAETIRMVGTSDGSSVGAALLALLAHGSKAETKPSA